LIAEFVLPSRELNTATHVFHKQIKTQPRNHVRNNMSAHQAGATTLTQQSENFGYSTVRLRRITKLQFGIVNPTELVCTTLCMSEYIRICKD
jgi:hypothetical protein